MTDAQQDALDKIKVIMREHFDAGVVMVTCGSERDDISDIQGTWHGGFAAAIGLTHLAHDYMEREDAKLREERDADD